MTGSDPRATGLQAALRGARAVNAPLALPVPPTDETPPPPEQAPLAAIAAPADAEPAAKFVGAGGQVYALTETTTTFGRRSTNHFVLSGDVGVGNDR